MGASRLQPVREDGLAAGYLWNGIGDEPAPPSWVKRGDRRTWRSAFQRGLEARATRLAIAQERSRRERPRPGLGMEELARRIQRQRQRDADRARLEDPQPLTEVLPV